MKTITKLLVAVSVIGTSGVPVIPVVSAAQAHSTYAYHTHRLKGRTHYARKYCNRSSATTGKVVGGVTGAVVGSKVLGGGLLGAAAGAVGGVVAGGAVDRTLTKNRRCYWR
jgi:uncharacterized protein YcfJ